MPIFWSICPLTRQWVFLNLNATLKLFILLFWLFCLWASSLAVPNYVVTTEVEKPECKHCQRNTTRFPKPEIYISSNITCSNFIFPQFERKILVKLFSALPVSVFSVFKSILNCLLKVYYFLVCVHFCIYRFVHIASFLFVFLFLFSTIIRQYASII